MNPETIYWHLQHFNLSKRLTKDEMIHMCSALVMKHYKKGFELRLEKGKSSDVFFLKKGAAKVIRLTKNGEEIIKDLINEGEIFGILGLLHGEGQNDYAVAMDDTIVCVIDVLSMKNLMEENRRLNNHIFKLAGIRIKKLERRLESLVHKDAKTRIEEFIMDYIMDFGREEGEFIRAKNLLSDSDIGKLTSTSRQTVNKTLNRLKLDNIIDFDRKFIRLKK